MTPNTISDELLKAHNYFETQSEGYQSWGRVEILQIAQKIDKNTYFLTSPDTSLKDLQAKDIQKVTMGNDLFSKLFSARKNIATILITKQTYASQVRETIPAILDDQAQLLGVSIRIAKNENDIKCALSGRFAAILPEGKSICIGSNIEETYVAAQLLEKTSKAWIEAKYLGGAKSINIIEAWLMQQFYQLKYSKEAKKNK